MLDYCVIGGGIVGLATAIELLQKHPGSKIMLLEKEAAVASHQTGHNSGVIHAGIYYPAGSLKAQLCRDGEIATKEFCAANGVTFDTIGKLVVATSQVEMERLDALKSNAYANGVKATLLTKSELLKREPMITGLAALHVPGSGIVDYKSVAQAMRAKFERLGGLTALGTHVDGIHEDDQYVSVRAGQRNWRSRQLVVCAGLQADRLAVLSGAHIDFQIVPFRGEYYSIAPAKRKIVRHMIYPVADPALPFLGVHLTPTIDGPLIAGPNAVLSLAREKYKRFGINAKDVSEYLRFPGFWKVAHEHMRSAAGELYRSLSKTAYLKSCQKYCPALTASDLGEYRSGIRAQAVTRSGKLVHDFLFHQTPRTLHVCNAPSPAATSAIPIARMIVERLMNGS